MPVTSAAVGSLLTLTFTHASGRTPSVIVVSGNVLGSQNFFGDYWNDEWPITDLSSWALLPNLAPPDHPPTGHHESYASMLMGFPSRFVGYAEQISGYSVEDMEFWRRGLYIKQLGVQPDSLFDLVGVHGAFPYHEYSAYASNYDPATNRSGNWTRLSADGTLTLVEYRYSDERGMDGRDTSMSPPL